MTTYRRRAALAAIAGAALALPAPASASYADSVLADGPLTYLRLGEAPGDPIAHDASINHRDGAYIGAATLGVAGPFADSGTAITLAKSGSLTAKVSATSGSVELWVNPVRLPKNAEAGIAAHGDPAADGWALGIGPKRKLAWRSGATRVQTTITLGSGVWTALTVTWDGQKVRFYRNGALAKTLNSTATPTFGNGDFVVGGNGAGAFTGQFSGKVDEVALYPQVLGASDVFGHFGATHVPVNTSPPAVTDDGTPAVGETLTVNPGTWTDAGDPAVYPRGYQWQRCDDTGEICADVAGATGPSHVLSAGDQCSTFQVVETVRNAYGTGSAMSEPTDPVGTCGSGAVPAPINEASPTIDGTLALGETLTVQEGAWSDAGDPALYPRGYQWQRCDGAGENCVEVGGATATTYVVTQGDECLTFRVVETVSNATGSDSAVSDPTGVVGTCGPGGSSDPGSGGGTGGGTSPTTTPAPGATPVVSGPSAGAAAGCLKLLTGRRKLELRGLGTLRLKATAGNCLTGPLAASFKASKGAKLKSVRYKLDGKRLKRAKLAARLKPAALPAGTHTLSVRVTLRDGRSKRGALRLRTAVG
jgi:hypothetical protein